MLEAISAHDTWGKPHAEPCGPGRGRRRPHTAGPAFSSWWGIMSFLFVGFLLASTSGLAYADRSGRTTKRAGQLKRSKSGIWAGHHFKKLNATSPAGKELAKLAKPRKRRVAADLVWQRMHRRLVAEVKANDKAKKPWLFVFYGDSTVEALRGTYLGNSWTSFSLGPRFWTDEMKHIPSGLMGIAGDEMSRLAYRLLDGEMPQVNKPLVIGLQIGTADLHPPNCDKATQERVSDNLHSILLFMREQAPEAHILVLGVFPKGASWPNICSKPIWNLNAYLMRLSMNDSHIHFMDIGRRFLAGKADLTPEEPRLMNGAKADHWDEQGTEINESFLPDSLNPGHMGLQVISREVSAEVTRLLTLADPIRYALPPAPDVPQKSTSIPQIAAEVPFAEG